MTLGVVSRALLEVTEDSRLFADRLRGRHVSERECQYADGDGFHGCSLEESPGKEHRACQR